MLQARTIHITVRPKQPLQILLIIGFLSIGVISAWPIYGRSGWLFAIVYLLAGVGFFLDRIVFDGTKLRRIGPGARLLALLGKESELLVTDIEAISSYASPEINGQLRFQTTINGEDIRWIIKSNQKNYPAFIKALFKAVPPALLDQSSTELLLFWKEPDPEFRLNKDNAINAYRLERWRRKAISLSFQGEMTAAANYFKLAHENSPNDPQIAHDIGRFLRRRAMSCGVRTEQGESDLFRSETYFRMAGRLAWEKKNARLLERVGEAFFEFHQLEAAKKYLELSTRIDPVRPRANICLAGIALQNCQGARAIYAFNQAAAGAEAAGITSLANYARRKSEYYERLLRDEEFLSKEAGWDSILTQLKWARRGAFTLFLLTWLMHLNSLEFFVQFREISREVSATSLIIWVCALTASQIILALRRSE